MVKHSWRDYSEAKMGYARGDVVIKLVEGGRETSKEGL